MEDPLIAEMWNLGLPCIRQIPALGHVFCIISAHFAWSMALKMWLQFLFLIGCSSLSMALADPQRITLSHGPGTPWTLEAKQASLAEIISLLTERMGIPIVSPPPPDQPLTLKCRGEDIQHILSCLLGSGASVMYRRGLLGQPDGISGVRILASTFAVSAGRKTPADPSHLASLLEMTRSLDPDTRVDGYTRLAHLGSEDQTIRRRVFSQGLMDDHGEVRAAALLGLHGMDPQKSREEMMMGLKDEDSSVRLAALDILGHESGSEGLLQQALNDPDELVRDLARLRLGLTES